MIGTGFAILRQGVLVVVRGVRQQPLPFATSVIGSLIFAAATVGSAYALSAVTARLVAPAFRAGGTSTGAAATAAAIVLGVIGIKMTGILVRRVAGGHLQFGLVAKSRLQLLRRYLTLPYEWLLRQSQGRLLSTVASDADASWVAMADLPLAVGAIAICLMAAVALWLTDPVLAIVGISAFPVLIGVNVIYSRAVTAPLTLVQRLRADVSAVAAENIDGAHVVRALGRADAEAQRFAVACNELRSANVRVARVRAIFSPLVEALPNIGSLALLLTGAMRMASGAIGVEQLISATLLFTAIAFPLGGLGWMLNQLPRGVVGWNRVRDVLDVAEPIDIGQGQLAERENRPMTLTLEGLSYSYRPDQPVLHDVELQARPGYTIGITGPTGSGKSTLARLIAGLLPPSHGSVLLDGVRVPDLALAGLVKSVAFVPQEPFLFAGSIRSNIALDSAVSDEQIWAALRLAKADGFVTALARGLDDTIGERGGTLSGGQRQRLALARAIVRQPRLLVLDDATSGLDAQVEEEVIGSLAGLDTTLVIIAHRPATLALATQIIFLDHGRITARGSHARLLETSPAYERLVRSRSEVSA